MKLESRTAEDNCDPRKKRAAVLFTCWPAGVTPSQRPSLFRILGAALRLGVTSFGGPIAHLGYFRRDYVEKLRWITEAEFAELVALAQFLPGPSSSQVGFGVGYTLRGWPGGLAAWLGFTLPSAAIMIAFARGLTLVPAGAGWIQGLKVAAVAIVAQAVLQMWRTLCPDPLRSGLAIIAAFAGLELAHAPFQVAIITVCALAGSLWLRDGGVPAPAVKLPPKSPGWMGLLLFAGLLAGLPLLAFLVPAPLAQIADRFFRAGALVFGGGHAVLPLLEPQVTGPGWLTHDQFVAGYGLAQALPGPLFTFAAYLGAALPVGPGGVAGGLWAMGWMFLPGLMLVPATLPHWRRLQAFASARGAMRGACAAVVGLLLAAWINPMAAVTLTDRPHILIAAGAFCLLQFPRLPSWLLVAACAAAGRFLL